MQHVRPFDSRDLAVKSSNPFADLAKHIAVCDRERAANLAKTRHARRANNRRLSENSKTS